MPVVTLAVPQTQETVTRSVVKSVVGDIMASIGVSPDTDVIYKEEIGSPPTTGGTLNQTPSVKLRQDNHVVVSYVEKYTEDGVLSSAMYNTEYPHVFSDRDIGIFIKPTYARVQIEATIRFEFREKTALSRIRRLFRMHHGKGILANKHNVRYEYSLHNDLLAFLYDAHAMQEPVGGVTETLKEYLQRCFLQGLGRRTSRSGDNVRLILDEIQGNIIGSYSEENFYNESESEGGNYALEFTYTFSYNQIQGTIAQYPNVIHNKRIPKSYRVAWAVADIPTDEETSIKTLSYMPPLWRGRVGKYYRGLGGYKLDPTDEWEPKNSTPNIKPIVLTPVRVNMGDPNLLLSVYDFTEEQLPLYIKEYICKYSSVIHELHQTPFLVQAYGVDAKETQTTITVLPNGEIRSTLPLSILKRHYVRISMMTDLSKLPTIHVGDMLVNPVDTVRVLRALHPNVKITDKHQPYEFSAGESRGEIVLSVLGASVETTIMPPSVEPPLETESTAVIVTKLNNGNREVRVIDYSVGKIKADSFRKAIKKISTTSRAYANMDENNPRLSSNVSVATRRSN